MVLELHLANRYPAAHALALFSCARAGSPERHHKRSLEGTAIVASTLGYFSDLGDVSPLGSSLTH